jgi:hypothetical protein
MPSRLATLSATISERMIFSPSLEATRSATSIPREPISRVMAITVMIASYLLSDKGPRLSPCTANSHETSVTRVTVEPVVGKANLQPLLCL